MSERFWDSPANKKANEIMEKLNFESGKWFKITIKCESCFNPNAEVLARVNIPRICEECKAENKERRSRILSIQKENVINRNYSSQRDFLVDSGQFDKISELNKKHYREMCGYMFGQPIGEDKTELQKFKDDINNYFRNHHFKKLDYDLIRDTYENHGTFI